jgi:Fe-Mn family superoxide dismutase
MTDKAKRETLALLGAGGASALLTRIAGAQTPVTSLPDVRSSMVGGREPKPLKFNPAKLNGLSEKLIRSHWENNYGGSVKTLNMISERLATAMKDPDFPPVVYYFDNLGGDGKAAGSVLAAIKKTYGSYDAWEAEFRRTAMSLAGGSGWCILTYNAYTHELRNQWAWDHMHGAVSGLPLLVLDMYEHSFHMDYGSAAAKYVDAFMRNVNWEEVDRRFAQRGSVA